MILAALIIGSWLAVGFVIGVGVGRAFALNNDREEEPEPDITFAGHRFEAPKHRPHDGRWR